MTTSRGGARPDKASAARGARGSRRGPNGSRGAGAGEEWVCGHRTLPVYVRQGGGSFRPEFAAWLGPGGVLAASPAHPDEVEGALLALLPRALTAPPAGGRRPASVRVSDVRLAPALRNALGPGVAVRVAPTPEIDALAAHFVEHLDREDPAPERAPWVDDGLDPELVRGFFAAAADLYRAAPWKAVPDDSTLFAVDAPSLSLEGACAAVIGGAGVEFGLLLFDSVAAYETMRQAGTAMLDEGEKPAGPGVPLVSISFEPAADMPKATRAAVARERWPVAGPKAYPLLSLIDADNVTRPATNGDVARAWALCEAFARLVREHRARLAGRPGPPLRATYALAGPPGRPEVTLTLPHPDDDAARLLADEGALAAEIDGWAAAFGRAQGAKRPGEAWLEAAVAVVGMLLEFKARAHRPTFGHWAPVEVEEFLVDHVPRRLDLSPAELDALPSALDAFFAWLGASGRSGAASSGAARRVIAALADESRRRSRDPANFGMAKAMLVKMREQGYDPADPQSLEAFTDKFNADVAAGREAPPAFRMMPLPPPPRGRSTNRARAAGRADDGDGLEAAPHAAAPRGAHDEAPEVIVLSEATAPSGGRKARAPKTGRAAKAGRPAAQNGARTARGGQPAAKGGGPAAKKARPAATGEGRATPAAPGGSGAQKSARAKAKAKAGTKARPPLGGR